MSSLCTTRAGGDPLEAVRVDQRRPARGMRAPGHVVGMLGAILVTEAELRAAAGDASGAAAAAREAVALTARAHLDRLLAAAWRC